MKGNRLYMLFLGACLVLVFLLELSAPRKFDWKPTFGKNDKEPFGCYVFDDVARSSFADYKSINKTLYQVFKFDSLASPDSLTFANRSAYLIIDHSLAFIQTDLEYLFKLLHCGADVMLCTEYLPSILEDTLRITSANSASHSSIEQFIKYRYERDTVYIGASLKRAKLRCLVYPPLHNHYLMIDSDSDSSRRYEPPYPPQTLSVDAQERALAMRLSVGKGRLYIVSVPLMFTNFGVLDGKNADYAFSLMADFKDRSVRRLDAYGKHGDLSATPLRFVLATPPLRRACYTALLTLLLCMTFSARRRQRVIPVVAPPPNRTISFMKLISNLYHPPNHNGRILKIKFKLFSDELKRRHNIDLADRPAKKADIERLAEHTGMDKERLAALMNELYESVFKYEYAETPSFMHLIDGMNEILRDRATGSESFSKNDMHQHEP